MSNRKRIKLYTKETVANTEVRECSKYIIEAFNAYREELDDLHDRHERLVKISRDITIKSKRIIFLLHRVLINSDRSVAILGEAETALKEVIPLLRRISEELEGRDLHRHHRAFTPGLQEFVEAMTFYHFLKCGELISPQEVEDFVGGQGETPWKASLLPSDYILGVSDIAGELMRLCISSISVAHQLVPRRVLHFEQNLYISYLSLGPPDRVKGLKHKVNNLKTCLGKVEYACYTLTVRGSEVPKVMLMSALDQMDGRNVDKDVHN